MRAHLAKWWGEAEVGGWKHLKTYRIPFAQVRRACRAVQGGGSGAAVRILCAFCRQQPAVGSAVQEGRAARWKGERGAQHWHRLLYVRESLLDPVSQTK